MPLRCGSLVVLLVGPVPARQQFFFPRDLDGLFEDLGLHGLSTEQPLQLLESLSEKSLSVVAEAEVVIWSIDGRV